jgi:hypothetical protein
MNSKKSPPMARQGTESPTASKKLTVTSGSTQQKALHLRSSLHFGIKAYFFKWCHHASAVEDPLIPNDLAFGKGKEEGESIVNRAVCSWQSEPTGSIRSGCLPEDYNSAAVHQNVGNLKCKITKDREQCLPRSGDGRLPWTSPKTGLIATASSA